MTAQEISWRAQVRVCRRYRRMVGRGKNPIVVVTAIAREIFAFLRAVAKAVPIGG
jgi:transposase